MFTTRLRTNAERDVFAAVARRNRLLSGRVFLLEALVAAGRGRHRSDARRHPGDHHRS